MSFGPSTRNFLLRTRQFRTLCVLKCCRFSSSDSQVDPRRIRNIGIMAHIDAGKTTTTERMLFYSGKINSFGEVHHGNTVTDYLEQERNRGITITSAAVTFPWRKHIINLVDTPGHIDFTMEVEQSLSVIDSAVIVLDASAGVEAQTSVVWQQADRQKLPRIVYANKFDRKDADLELCIKSIEGKLSSRVLPLHLPVIGKQGFRGVVDLVTLEEILWFKEDAKYKVVPVEKTSDSYEEIVHLRSQLIDRLSTMDDTLAETIIANESLDNVSGEELRNAVRRATISLKGVPLLCGSSYKNVGVQTLMDAILDYLPSPRDAPSEETFDSFKHNLAARAFKIMHDKQRGPVTFLRVYRGTLSKGQKVYNVNQNCTTGIDRIMLAFANEFQDVPTLPHGYFGAVTGLKGVTSGDLLCSSSSSVKSARQTLMKSMKMSEEEVNSLLRVTPRVPEPVFFCSIEPSSQAYQTALDKALSELQLEDPSLSVKYDSNTGQTVLGGLGELHLDIVRDKLKTNYKLEVHMGPLQIAYKEELNRDAKESCIIKHSIASQDQYVNLTLSLRKGTKKDLINLDMSSESAANLAHITPKSLNAIRRGVSSALNQGPLFSCPVIEVHGILHWLEVGRGTSETLIAAAASQCVNKVLQSAGTKLLEPVMSVFVIVPEEYINVVLSDLSRRRSVISSVDRLKNLTEIKTETPLAELLGYAKELRTMTSGSATLSITFLSYGRMSQQVEENVIRQSFGY